jgi:hypothetical protein
MPLGTFSPLERDGRLHMEEDGYHFSEYSLGTVWQSAIIKE